MTIRNSRERLVQSAGYEIGSLVVATPICALLTGSTVTTSAGLVIVLTVATMLWAPLFNTAFDRVEWRLTGRLASNRTMRMRMVHAFGLEASDTVISLPILMTLGGLDLGVALLADLGLLGVYMVYTYLYHSAYDRVRTVRRPVAAQSSSCTPTDLAGPA